MIDGYQAYESVCVKYDIQRLGCWAHARRKFSEAKKEKTQNKIGKADVALGFIQKLYAIEQKTADLQNALYRSYSYVKKGSYSLKIIYEHMA